MHIEFGIVQILAEIKVFLYKNHVLKDKNLGCKDISSDFDSF